MRAELIPTCATRFAVLERVAALDYDLVRNAAVRLTSPPHAIGVAASLLRHEDR